MTGLTAGTTYYFALKVADEVPNRSTWSNVPSGTTQPPSDATPPAAVTTLAVGATTQTTVPLTWTAVGDDDNTGQAASYDLRYSTSLITGSNWGSAVQVSGEPPPQPAGQTDSFTVTGLSAGTTYYFALKVGDEVPNWSSLSNVPSGRTRPSVDITPPAGINDLALLSTDVTWVELIWTAPGDDGTQGQATSYLVRYRTGGPISSESEWQQALPAEGDIPSPSSAGMRQESTITGLVGGTTYGIAIRALDEQGNLGGLSNPIAVTTLEVAPPPPPLPAPVTQLAVVSVGTQSAILELRHPTPPDGGLPVIGYAVGLARSVITLETWSQADTTTPGPEPGPPNFTARWTLAGLASGTEWFVAVRPRDAAGQLAPLSPVVFFRTELEDLSPLAAPDAPEAVWSKDGDFLAIRWSPSVDPRAIGYRVYGQWIDRGWQPVEAAVVTGTRYELSRTASEGLRRLAISAVNADGHDSPLSLPLVSHRALERRPTFPPSDNGGLPDARPCAVGLPDRRHSAGRVPGPVGPSGGVAVRRLAHTGRAPGPHLGSFFCGAPSRSPDTTTCGSRRQDTMSCGRSTWRRNGGSHIERASRMRSASPRVPVSVLSPGELFGGVETQVLGLCVGLRERGVDVLRSCSMTVNWRRGSAVQD